MVAYLQKSKGSEGANGEVELTATIDGQVKTITEASLRRHLKLEDNGGITTLPNSEIFEQPALIPKKTAWEQFSSNIATAIICLAINRTYNFSKLIFDAMIKNLENPHKFLMYPRFIQIWLNKQRRLLQPHTQTYPTPILTQKVFSNMKRVSKGYFGIDFSLFPTMISAPETSPSRITSSPSSSPQHTPVSTPQPPNTQPTSNVEEAVLMPHESPLYSVHSLGRDEGSLSLNELKDLCTSLSKKIVKSTQARRRFKIVISDDKEDLEDPSKQERKITKIDQDPSISLVQDEGTSWIQEDIEIQEKISDDTEVVLEEEEPTELVEDQGSGEKGEKEVSTVGAKHSTVIPEVSTIAANLQLEQEILRHEEAIRLQEQIDEEERQIIARDAEIAMQLQEEINKATQEQEKQEVVIEADPTHVIDWNYEDKEKGSKKKAGGSRKKTLARKRAGEKQSDQSAKRQKTEYEKEKEKEELKAYLDLFPRVEFVMEIECLDTKYLIVDWKTHVLTETFMYYQIIRADRGSKNYQIFSKMLDDFDRQDVIGLHRLVEERYATSRLERYDLMLWGDLKILFQPDEEDEVWRHQHEYNLIS
ncbi:hypothetical protein Tco_1414665 [Tanacetum coccineum]